MPDPVPLPTDLSADRPAEPERQRPRSELPLGFGNRSALGITLPPSRPDEATPRGGMQATIDAPSTNNSGPHPLHERDHELIDYLIQKALETCSPCRQEHSRALPEQRPRSTKRPT